MLKETYIHLLENYSGDSTLIIKLWTEIEKNYSGPKRHYHNLDHLNDLLHQLNEVKPQIINWDTILFTLYYHDIIYNALKSDNEKKSAELAEERMKQLAIPESVISNCKAQILSTKTHFESSDSDTNYFTDADLSILGRDWETYSTYFKNVRKEYSIYPDLMYNPGRKKVLAHFLEMERIYKTEYFHSRFEQQAKQNLQRELDLLRK